MSRTACAVALALLPGPALFAQVPAVPVVPVAPAVPGAVAPAVPAAAPAGNLWSFLCMTPEQKARCKQKLCASPLIQMLGGMLAPVRAVSGGLLPRVCPGPLDANPADLVKPADSAEGAAARIKAREAEAKARRAAIRYLGTVDCRRYPEAEAALINGLRADENECVRFEAALALGNGCCCSKKIIEALTATVSGVKTTEPAETSPRVRAAAAVALERCLAVYCEEDAPAAPPERPILDPMRELPPEPGRPAVITIRLDPLEQGARTALDRFKRAHQPVVQVATSEPPMAGEPVPVRPVVHRELTPPPEPARIAPPSGQRNLWSLLRHAAGGG